MPEYLTSSEALLAMSEAQPAHPVKGGLKSLGKGIIGTAAGVAGGPYAFNYLRQNYDFDWKTAGFYLGSVALTIGGTWYGLYKLADGVTSFFDPMLKHTRDGSVYRRNGGYVADHSGFDRRFGRVIRPVEDPAEVEAISKRGLMKSPEFFMNGAVLKSITLQKEETKEIVRGGRKVTRTRWVRATPEEVGGTLPSIGYRALATVEFKGAEFSTVSENSGAIKFLAAREIGSALRLRGQYEAGETVFDIKEVNEALLRDVA